MKSAKHMYGIIASLLILMSCNKRDPCIARQIGEFKKSRICVDTDSLVELCGHLSENRNNNIIQYAFVMYVDNEACSTCILKEMDKWELYLEEMSGCKLSFLPVFVPDRQNVHEFIYKATSLNNSFPIYIDTSGYFVRKNPSLTKIRVSNTFMVNSDGEVVIVGNPTKNPNIKQLVKSFLDENNR